MILAGLLACADGSGPPVAPGAEIWVEARAVPEGAPALLHAPATTVLPEVEGLSYVQTRVTDDGRATWEVRGAPGSYIVPVPGSGGVPVNVYLDLGVKGPSGGPMDDLVGLPAPQPPTWPYWVAGLAAIGLGSTLGVLAWRRFRPVPPPPPPEPADVVARREWARLRARTDLSPAELALALSTVFRHYLEAAHRWPATRRTTREILDTLAGVYTAAELDSSRRLLMAMDLVKFADRAEQTDLLDRLDHDFAALVRPVRGPDA